MVLPVSSQQLHSWGTTLVDNKQPIATRFRALFGLRHAAEPEALTLIGRGFGDSSALLKHEMAYVLGQKGDVTAVPILLDVLQDDNQPVIVRHEAGEALGALGHESARPALLKFSQCDIPDLAETCEVALGRLDWLRVTDSIDREKGLCEGKKFNSVDPAPPYLDTPGDSVSDLGDQLVDEKESLFSRYRAMFTLRNKVLQGGSEAAQALRVLSRGLTCQDSALFRHEVAYVLGQAGPLLHSQEVLQGLVDRLTDVTENGMVRHECAEALGALCSEESKVVLCQYLHDPEPLVSESCEVALDMVQHETGGEFQYVTVPTTSE